MTVESPTTSDHSNRQLLPIVKGLLAVIGLFIAGFGCLLGLLIALSLMLTSEAAVVDSSTAGLAIVALSVGLGGALAWQAGRSLFQKPSARFWLPPVGLFILVFVAAVAAGQALISFELWPIVTFPPFHVVAATLPPLVILAFVGRALRSGDFRWREVIVQLAGGAFLSISLALILEIITGLIILALVVVVMALLPGGLDSLEAMVVNLQNPVWLENPENITQLLGFPPVWVTLAVVFIILAPLIEELGKIIGVVAMSYRRPTLPQAFLWGIAAGAGLGLMENLFNTITNLEIWALVILMRLGATLMHCLATGLLAMSWQRYLTERRIFRLLGAYGRSVAIHAVWNGIVVAMAGSAVFAAGSVTELTQMLGGGAAVLLLSLLGLFFMGMIVALVAITRRLRAQITPSPSLVESTAE